MSKKNAANTVAVVDAVSLSAGIIADVLARLPQTTEAKTKLDEQLAKEGDFKAAKVIINSFKQLESDPVETLELQISSFKDKDKVALAKQKLEVIRRYNAWQEQVDSLRKEVNESYSVLDEVIAGLMKERGLKPASKSGNSGGGGGSIACTVTNVSDSSVMHFPSLNSAIDELIPKDKRSKVWAKDEAGNVLRDSEGNPVQEVDKNGNPKYYSLSAKNAKSALKTAGYEVSE